MPYQGERASRLGHVDMVRDEHIRLAMQGWTVSHQRPSDASLLENLCKPISDLSGGGVADKIQFALTVDGSDTEVEATREYPSVKVGYLRIAGSFLDLSKLEKADNGPYIDSSKLRQAYTSQGFHATLPGSGLNAPGLTGEQTWRSEVAEFLTKTVIDGSSTMTLADALLVMHGQPGKPASTLPVRKCPECLTSFRGDETIQIPLSGGKCTKCRQRLSVADVVRSSEEYTEVGSNLSPLTRLMLLAERLVILGYMELVHSGADVPGSEMLSKTIHISDGPLALMGTAAPLKRRIEAYHEALFNWSAQNASAGPFLVGVEKSGQFSEHAEQIRDLVPEGNVMMLTNDYINRMTGRPATHEYGVDEFYGRRFFYRTTSGDLLVITVPPKPGVSPYVGQECETFDSYPTLRPICEVLDRVRTRLYPNSVIPVALAHNAAALPLGVGHSVLQAMTQEELRLRKTHQIKGQPHY